MKKTHKFTLERPARKTGGDRYKEETPHGGDRELMMGVAYVNQFMSRTGNIPIPTLWITISTEAPTD